GGDLSPIRASVVDAMASGKLAAYAIHRSLIDGNTDLSLMDTTLGEGPAFSIEACFNPRQHWSPKSIAHVHELDLATCPLKTPVKQALRDPFERIRNFEEVVFPLDWDNAQEEASRCFFCGTCIGCDRCYIYCPEISILKPDQETETYRTNPDYCKGCGACASECVRDVLRMGEET
ncbi:unnamed protein product, partial [marine sediment metagenome]